MKKHIANISVFFILIFCFMIAWLFGEKSEIIHAERRKASPMPPISEIFQESFSGDFDKHFLDTFPRRETFRTLDAAFRKNTLQQRDINGIYKVREHLSKIEAPLDEAATLHAAKKISEIAQMAEKAYLCIIPDKNYFLYKEKNYPHTDYEKMMSLLLSNIENAEYINIFDTLTIDNYYKTDTHWRQETLLPTAEKILSALNTLNTPNTGTPPHTSNDITSISDYTLTTYDDFYGVYAAQSAFNTPPETLVTLTSESISGAEVTSAEDKGTFPVYQSEKFEGHDSYDVFLGGAKALLDIKRPLKEGETEKKLVLFRDSFGSSIAPLFLENYTHITMVDLRYLSSKLLPEFVDFENSDVLFLYNTQIINNGYLLK